MVENNQKAEILDVLFESLRRASAMEVQLTLQDRQSDANEFGKRTKKLSRRIDDAMGELIDEWAEQSSTIHEDIKALNEKLATAKQELSDDVDNAKQIVDAIGHIDELIFIAKCLLKP